MRQTHQSALSADLLRRLLGRETRRDWLLDEQRDHVALGRASLLANDDGHACGIDLPGSAYPFQRFVISNREVRQAAFTRQLDQSQWIDPPIK